jgi:hypothetical protein
MPEERRQSGMGEWLFVPVEEVVDYITIRVETSGEEFRANHGYA